MIDKLLIEVSEISKKYDLIYQKTGEYFNIFNITDISTDEVTICKVLYEFINPCGSHYQGDTYLRLFIKDVLKMNFTEQDYKSVSVFREYLIDGNRRVDLFIVTDNYKIPIEVKIYADDQNNQCYDYHKRAVNSNVFYLTLIGYAPSPESVGDLKPIYDDAEIIGYEGITQISFSHDIMDWLNNCLTHPDTIKIAPIREIILQFKDVIGKLTGQVEGDAKMEIANKILSSTDNIKSALDIEKALPDVKSKIMKNLFCELKDLFENNNKSVFDYDEDVINEYYIPYKKLYPCISVEIKKLPYNLTAALGIEVDENLYFNFAFMEVDKSGKYSVYKEIEWVKSEYPEIYNVFVNAINEVMGLQGKKSKNLIFWDYILDDRGQKYNFKNFSSSCVDLAENYKEQAKRIYKILNGYIDRLTFLG